MYIKETLPNGVRLVTEEIKSIHSASIGIWVKTGSRYEKDHNHGISHFVEHMLFKGTAKRSARKIAEELEAIGGTLNAFTAKEYTCYYAKVLAENLDTAMDVLADMYFNSLFEPKEIEKEKNVIMEEIKMYEDSPDELVHDLFANAVWPNHPLGRPIIGTIDSLKKIQCADLLEYCRNRYTANNTVIAIAGNIEHKNVVDQISGYFGNMAAGHDGIESEPPVAGATVLMAQKDLEQLQICLGGPGLAQDDDDIYVLNVLNNVLGGGLSSRLFQEIREERGLAYSVYSYQTAYRDSGLFTIYAGTSPDNLEAVLRLIVKELLKLGSEGISEGELKRTKQQLKGNLLLSLENVNNRMMRLGKTEICFDRVITIEEILNKIAAVDLEAVKSLAKRLFLLDNLTFTSIGPVIHKDLSLKDLV
ncbi:MAG: M16 family metallopeptidase [Bacillota bacterium]